MNETTRKRQLSQSQLNLYAKCPEAYRRRYLDGDKVPPGIALLVGTGVHVGSETNFRQKIESHENMKTDDVIDASVAGFEERVRVEGYELTSDEQSIGSKKVIGQATDTVVSLATLHAEEQAKDYQPIEVEKPTHIVLPSCEYDLVSITDLRDDQGRVIDLKTAARKPPQDEAAKSLQLTINAASYQVDHGKPPTEVRLDVLTKTKTPQRHVVTSTRDADDFRALAARIDAVAKSIASGNFPPTDPSNWACSERWCGYYRTCPYVNPKRK